MDIKKAAKLAKLAYEQDHRIMLAWLQKMFGESLVAVEFIFVKRTDTEGFVCRVGNECIIAFSGTESMTDLWHDLLFIPSGYPSGYIHSGFKEVSESVEKAVVFAVNKLFPERPDKIISVGHSLGAQIALCVCDTLYFSGYLNVPMKIITFGCPNGWSRGAIRSFNRRHPNTRNFINKFDIITWLLVITTGRPGDDIKLSGKYGHGIDKYISNA